MATVTPMNVFEPDAQREEDEATEALAQLLQDVAREAFLILTNMQLTCEIIAKKTVHYQNQLYLNKAVLPAKTRVVFVDVVDAMEHYYDHIRQYHELLATDACSFHIPLWAYKQLRHQLVLRVVQDIRITKRCVDGFSRLRERKKKRNLLMDRWQRELVNFTVLAT